MLEELELVAIWSLRGEDLSGDDRVDCQLGHLQGPEQLPTEACFGPQQEAALGVDDELVLVGAVAQGVQIESTSGERAPATGKPGATGL